MTDPQPELTLVKVNFTAGTLEAARRLEATTGASLTDVINSAVLLYDAFNESLRRRPGADRRRTPLVRSDKACACDHCKTHLA